MMDDNTKKEVLFGRILAELRKKAMDNDKSIGSDEIEEAFADIELDASQLVLVRDYLEKQGIQILSPGQEPAAVMSRPPLTGGEREYTDFVGRYMDTIRDIARLYNGQGILHEDLISEGYLILSSLLADRKGPASKAEEKELEEYLTRSVMDGMESCIEANEASSLAENAAIERVRPVAEAASELSEALRRKVTIKELLAENRELTEDQIREAIRLSGGMVDVE